MVLFVLFLTEGDDSISRRLLHFLGLVDKKGCYFRDTDDFCTMTVLGQGTRSWIAARDAGKFKEATGTSTPRTNPPTACVSRVARTKMARGANQHFTSF